MCEKTWPENSGMCLVQLMPYVCVPKSHYACLNLVTAVIPHCKIPPWDVAGSSRSVCPSSASCSGKAKMAQVSKGLWGLRMLFPYISFLLWPNKARRHFVTHTRKGSELVSVGDSSAGMPPVAVMKISGWMRSSCQLVFQSSVLKPALREFSWNIPNKSSKF